MLRPNSTIIIPPILDIQTAASFTRDPANATEDPSNMNTDEKPSMNKQPLVITEARVLEKLL
jgi:hypothetical protein